jgi:hypothetical protein
MTCYWFKTLVLNITKKNKATYTTRPKKNSMFGLLLESHCVHEIRWKIGMFSVQSVMNDLKSQLWKTGYIAVNAKDGGMGSVLRLSEILHLTATFSKHWLLGDVLCTLKSKGI